MIKNRLLLFIVFTLILNISLLPGQSFYDIKFMTVSGKVSPEKAKPGSTIEVIIKAEIEPEYHVNSNNPTDENLIPTILKFEPLENASFGKIIYPEPELVTFSFSEEALSVYQGDVTFSVNLTLSDKFPLGMSKIKGTLSFQACNDQSCFAPSDENFEIPFEVVSAQKVAPVEMKKDEAKPILELNDDAKPETTAIDFEEDISKQISQETEQA